MFHRGHDPREVPTSVAQNYAEHHEEIVKLERDIVKNGVLQALDEAFN